MKKMNSPNLLNVPFLFVFCCIPLLMLYGFPVVNAEEMPGYIGEETCKECHEEQYASYARSIHFKKSVKGPESQNACETCHGPGAMHVEKGGGRGVDIFDFNEDVESKARSSRCLTCHISTPGMDMWDNGAHIRNGVACDSCHVLHTGRTQKPNQPEVCFECHRGVMVETNKRSHHPVREGKLSCTSCHAPHGSMTRHMLVADDAQELCFKCHADKRGPVIWEHPPVEDNCQSCHSVHGSSHEQLLNERIPQLCQNCHDWSRHPGTPYDNAARYSSRWNCLRCHPAIHGSNSPHGGGMRYVR